MKIKISVEQRAAQKESVILEEHIFNDSKRAVKYLNAVYHYGLEINETTFSGCKFHDENDEWIIVKPMFC
jgi:hypothetical protein